MSCHPREEDTSEMKAKTNLTMLCDFYELTMGNGYFQTGLADRVCYFDVFYRSVPDRGGFAIAAGLAQVVEYIENLRFDEEDIAYLRRRGHPFRDRAESVDLAGRARQQAGTHCRRQHLRRKQPLSRLSGFVCSEIV